MVAVRFLYGLRLAGPIAIGSGTISWKRFLVLNLFGAGVWAAAIGGLGYAGGCLTDWAIAAMPSLRAALVAAMVIIVMLIVLRWRDRGSARRRLP